MQKRNSLKIHPSRLKVSLLLAGLVTFADQVTKYLVKASVGSLETIDVIEGFFRIVYARNTGVAFGFLSSLSPKIINPVLTAVNLVIMAFLVLVVLIENFSILTRSAFGLILGGAAGNLIDRLLHGFVVDFLDVYIGNAHWPAFNVADAAITVGVFLLIADTLFLEGRRRKTA